MTAQRTPRAALVGGAVVLVVLAIANASGYRYGVSDQAFYIPSILHAVDPSLYPRDAALLDAQGRLMVSDELAAWLTTTVPLPLESWLLLGHVASLVLLFASVWLIARQLASSRWTAAACCLAVTLRHRITETGANSFEGYFHPRGLAFACGAAGAAALARDRLGLAWALAILAMVIHPTTGGWWVLWLAGATIVMRPRWRRHIVEGTVAAVLVAAAVLTFTPLGSRLQTMDAAWIRPFASKDYVFPTAWEAGHWIANLALPLVVVGVWHWRRTRGRTARWEGGVVAGVVVLSGVFLLSLPFIAARVALAVQLQASRVFWIVDLFAVIAAAWALAEAAGGRPADAPAPSEATRRAAASPDRRRRPMAVAAVLFAFSAGRGVYTTQVEHPERAFVQRGLADTPWVRIGAWLATRTPADTHVLADPDHDWRFGHSVRVTAKRDVLVEGVKDAAVSLYDREVALRVQARLEAIGDFATMDAARARALAERFDLDVIVIDRDLPLPELHRDGAFRVYRLRSPEPRALTPEP